VDLVEETHKTDLTELAVRGHGELAADRFGTRPP
jgi:hypothetical protein